VAAVVFVLIGERPTWSIAAELVPLKAAVITAGAPVHSGPGDNYYLTDTLPEGESIDVYRRRDDGWCAIRPPADSFSWVFASNLQLDDDGLAKVTRDGTASRVGSRLSTHRDVVQVRLHKGEVVKVLGKDDRGNETWYKIAPPAGEFRWVAANCLAFADGAGGRGAAAGNVTQASHDQPANATDGKTADLMAPPLMSATDLAPPVSAPVSPFGSTPPAVSASASGAASAAAAKPAPIAPAPVASNSPSTPAATSPTTPSSVSQSAVSAATPKADITPVAAPAAASPDVARGVAELEIRLSRMVAESPATWNIDALQQSGEQLLSKADTAADRYAIKTTLAKIDRFAAIQRRSAAVGGSTAVATAGAIPGAIAPSSVTPLAGAGTAGAASVASAADGQAGQFDAVGVLRPVVSRRPGAPQYALVDDRGQVVTFVTPTPDVNLQPYLGRRIGVVGSRGYIPEFHRAHVTASRVAPLSDTVLR
jgi:hypothetical protein